MAVGDLLSFALPPQDPLQSGSGMSGDIQIMPSPPSPTPGTAVAPVDSQLQQNKSLWQRFLSTVNDPNIRQGILQTGLGLMRTPQMGQDNFDVASNAIGAGVGTVQALRDKQKKEKLAATAVATEQKNTEFDQAQKNRTTAAYEQQVATGAKASDAAITRAQKELDEAVRSNKSREEIQRLQAAADMLRAKSYAGINGAGGKTPQDIQKIQMLAAKYKAEGLDDVSANAKATMFIETASRGATPSQQVLNLVQDQVKAYNENPMNWKNPLTPEQQQKLMDDAINTVMQLNSLDRNARGEPAAGTATPGQGGNPQAPAAASTTDAQIQQKVNTLKSRGVAPAEIKNALQQMGLNPKLYGY